MKRFPIVGLVLGLCVTTILSLGAPAQAHTLEEMEQYEADWIARVTDNGGLSTELLEELRDFKARHAWHYFDEDAPYGVQGAEPTYVSARQDWGPAVENWRPLVAGHFAPSDVETAMCLMYYESRGNPSAKNPRSSASGLFQLLSTWHTYFGIDPFVPEQNVYAAARLKSMYGWTQWSPYNRGLCRGL